MVDSYLSYKKLKIKYLKFIKSQEILSEPFRDKIGQLNKFYLPLSKKIYKNAGDYMSILDTEIERLNKDDLNVDYLELRKTDNLSNVEDYKNISGQYILLGAIRLGETRLIDNIIL